MGLRHKCRKNTFSVSLYNHSVFVGISTGYVIKQSVHAFQVAVRTSQPSFNLTDFEVLDISILLMKPPYTV